MTLLESSELRVKLKALEAQLTPELGLLEKCAIQDEILEIKEQLGEFERTVQEGGECENCSG